MSSPRILLVSYYGFKDSLICAREALERLGYEVSTFPLLRYLCDVHDRTDKYLDMFLEQIDEENPSVILWWYFGLPTAAMETVRKSTDAVHILFNWDDPHAWNVLELDLPCKAPLLDAVLTCCRSSIENYKSHGTPVAVYALPGFDPKVHCPGPIDPNFQCDVSFCCTNLYESEDVFPNQYTNRKELVDKLAAAKDIDFRLYGPDFLRDLYPHCYRGLVPYSRLVDVFRSSKLCLCTHTTCTEDGYLNERVSLILGSGALLWVDRIAGVDSIIRDGVNCIVIDKDDPVKQARDLLHKDLKDVRRRGQITAAASLTWDTWAKTLHAVVLENYQEIYEKMSIGSKKYIGIVPAQEKNNSSHTSSSLRRAVVETCTRETTAKGLEKLTALQPTATQIAMAVFRPRV